MDGNRVIQDKRDAPNSSWKLQPVLVFKSRSFCSSLTSPAVLTPVRESRLGVLGSLEKILQRALL